MVIPERPDPRESEDSATVFPIDVAASHRMYLFPGFYFFLFNCHAKTPYNTVSFSRSGLV